MKRKSAFSALQASKNKNIKLESGESSPKSGTASPIQGRSTVQFDDTVNEDGNVSYSSFNDVNGNQSGKDGNDDDSEEEDEYNSDISFNSGFSSRQRSKSIDVDNRKESNSTELIPISTFIPSSLNTIHLQSGSTIYGLQKNETISIKGEYSLVVQKGAIRLLGVTLHANERSYNIISPCNSSHVLPTIESVQVENTNLVTNYQTEDNESIFNNYKSIIKIEYTPSGLQNIPQLAPAYKNLWNSSNFLTLVDTNPHTNSIYQIIEKAPANVSLFNPYKSWYKVANKVLLMNNSSPKVLVLGSKSSGKSSFCKFLINYLSSQLVEKTHYLELDPGQPEFCPPGTVSLHSSTFNFNPSFSHSNFHNTIKAHSLGFTSPRDAPDQYLSYCYDLYKTFEKDDSPLIINTPGWTRGLGLDLLTNIISFMQPDIIITLGPEESLEDLKNSIPAHTKTPITSIESIALDYVNSGYQQQSGSGKFSASDLRTLQSLTYFHSKSQITSFNPTHLTEIAPFMVPYEDPSNSLSIQGIAITAGEGIDLDDVSLCLNGSIVSIISITYPQPTTIPIQKTPIASLPYIHPNDIPNVLIPEISQCLGYAIVQSIDTDTKTLRLITPISPTDLTRNTQQKLILIRGRLQIPLWDLWNPTLDSTFTSPYLTKKRLDSGVGSQTWRVRRNVLRRVHG